MKIALLGRHSNRTPIAYHSYSSILPGDIQLVPSIEEADAVVLGFEIDLLSLSEEQQELLANRRDIRLLVISEEPLWDTVWASDYQSRVVQLPTGIQYECYNHFNSSLFKFERIPYFLTTNNHFLVRYRAMLQANSFVTAREIEKHWSSAQYKGAFFLERRDDRRYAVQGADGEPLGLSFLRSSIAAKFYGLEGYLVTGKGWRAQGARQLSADWHLEKLSVCKNNAAVLMAAENTYHCNYVTEKVFDSYACLAVPLVYGGLGHRYSELLPNESYVNLRGLTTDKVFEAVETIVFDSDFIARYQSDIQVLIDQTLTAENLAMERHRVVSELASIFRQ